MKHQIGYFSGRTRLLLMRREGKITLSFSNSEQLGQVIRKTVAALHLEDQILQMHLRQATSSCNNIHYMSKELRFNS